MVILAARFRHPPNSKTIYKPGYPALPNTCNQADPSNFEILFAVLAALECRPKSGHELIHGYDSETN